MESKPLVDYKKYRWFFTSTEKLVVGGKSSTQNDELLKRLKKAKKNFIVMHTSTPGSPFSVILEQKSSVTSSDLEEAAIFTGCFSRAWKEQKKKVQVDIFSLAQLYKSRGMKTGTWGVKDKVKRKSVTLELVLTKQKERLRAVPEKTAKKNSILAKIKPGKVDKTDMLPKFYVVLPDGFATKEELLSALPAGGVSISKR